MMCGVFQIGTPFIYAQTAVDRGLNSINRVSAEAIVGFLADDELQGREAGTIYSRIAARYLAASLKEAGINPLYDDSYFQHFEACAKERQQKGARWQVHPDSISSLKNGTYRVLRMANVLGIIPGEKTDEYVIVGAHFDHLGVDETLANDPIYNGADDNASGVSAVLQIARAFKASGKNGFIGKVKGYLNFDMIGRNSKPECPNHVVYFYTASHPAFGKWLKDDIIRYGLHLEPDYRSWDRPVGGSDNASFAVLDIPIIWYHTDGHPDYHQPSDHADRLNWEKVVDITKASFLNMWNLANESDY